VQQTHSHLINANAGGRCMHRIIPSHSVSPSLPTLPNSHETPQRKAHACAARHSLMLAGKLCTAIHNHCRSSTFH
jgi:hypothetical protein